MSAGFSDIALLRSDQPMRLGDNVEEAVGLAMAIGPAGEVLRLAGDAADELRPQIESALRDMVGDFGDGDGPPVAPTSTWVVTATAP